MSDFICDTIDGPAICTVIPPNNCCPPTICNLEIISFICSFFAYLPKGPLWDYWRRLRVEQLAAANEDDLAYPLVTDQQTENANCLTIINYAECTARNLFYILRNPFITIVFESDPTTAFYTRQKWLDDYGWNDCFSGPSASPQLGFPTPYQAVCNALLPPSLCPSPDEYSQMTGTGDISNPIIDIETFVKAACPPDLQAAVEHAILVSMKRNEIGVIKNADGINFILAPLKSSITIVNSGNVKDCQEVMVGDCNQMMGNEPCVIYRPTLHIKLSHFQDTIDAGPGITEPLTCDNIQNQPTQIPISYYFNGIIMPETTDCPPGTLRGNGVICPALMAAECILTAILPSHIRYDIERLPCDAPPVSPPGGDTTVLKQWISLGVSADGTKIIVASFLNEPSIGPDSPTSGPQDSDIYISNNSGFTFINTTGLTGISGSISGLGFTDCAVSRDGSLFAACTYNGLGGDVYTSTDGILWTNRTSGSSAANLGFTSVIVSYDGSEIVCSDGAGNVWYSINSGIDWIEVPDPTTFGQSFGQIRGNSDLTKMIAGYLASDRVMIASAGPTDWVSSPNLTINGSTPVAINEAGSYFITGAPPGQIQTSTDNITWTTQDNSPNTSWIGLACNSTGSIITGAASFDPSTSNEGSIYRSENGGGDWETLPAPQRLYSGIWSSLDGTKLVAITNKQGILISQDSGVTWNLTNI